jgi:hypothetical protein
MRLSLASGLVLLCLVCAAVGFWIGNKKVWPYDQLRESYQIARSLVVYGKVLGDGLRFKAPPGVSRVPAVLHDPGKAMGEGHYALLGWDSTTESYAVRLYDGTGTLAHTWPVDEMSFSERAEHRQNAPHAMEVLRDGSVLVSFDWLGVMARLDPCGKALWHRYGFYHHSFSPAADGGIWTWYGEKTAYGQIQDILKFDPITGADRVRISLNRDVIMRTPESALMFSMTPNFRFVPDDQNPRDILHPNDVEELLPEMAAAFPMFEAGDLMLSIRELNMVAVIAPSGELKWVQQGPWLKQHDPDFEPDGRISVFNNSGARPPSSIMTINPTTRRVVNPLPERSVSFYTRFRGKHQLLPNGNRLITIPEQGQVIEVTPEGTVALEFNNVSADDPAFNEDLVNAKWYPDGFFDSLPSCSPS